MAERADGESHARLGLFFTRPPAWIGGGSEDAGRLAPRLSFELSGQEPAASPSAGGEDAPLARAAFLQAASVIERHYVAVRGRPLDAGWFGRARAEAESGAPSLDGLVASLRDPYTQRVGRDRYASLLRYDASGGVGANLDSSGLVLGVVKGSPADKAGLEAGDLVERVGGWRWPWLPWSPGRVPVASADLAEAAARARRAWARGARAAAFGLVVSGGDGRRRHARVVLGDGRGDGGGASWAGDGEAASGRQAAGRGADGATASQAWRSEGAAARRQRAGDGAAAGGGGGPYDRGGAGDGPPSPVAPSPRRHELRLFSATPAEAARVAGAARALANRPRNAALYLDLRGNSGGALTAGVDMAAAFLPAGRVVAWQRYRDGGERAAPLFGSPLRAGLAPEVDRPLLAVLVDEGTASAAEVAAGALRRACRAALVAPDPSSLRTHGKGAFQRVFELVDGSALVLSAGEWVPGEDPSGPSVDGRGLAADFVGAVPSPEELKEFLEGCRVGPAGGGGRGEDGGDGDGQGDDRGGAAARGWGRGRWRDGGRGESTLLPPPFLDPLFGFFPGGWFRN